MGNGFCIPETSATMVFVEKDFCQPKYVGKVDALICEGTTLNRPDYFHISEQELQSQIKTVLEENKYV